MGLFVVFPHVTERVEANSAADHTIDQRHDDCKFVHEQMVLHLHVGAGRLLKPQHQSGLRHHQQDHQQLFGAHADIDEEKTHGDFDRQHDLTDHMSAYG